MTGGNTNHYTTTDVTGSEHPVSLKRGGTEPTACPTYLEVFKVCLWRSLSVLPEQKGRMPSLAPVVQRRPEGNLVRGAVPPPLVAVRGPLGLMDKASDF